MPNIINVEGGYAVEGSDRIYKTKAEATRARAQGDTKPVVKKSAKKTAKKATRKRK